MSGFVRGETPEGWYDDPQSSVPGEERWWNGVQWTAHTRRPEVDPPVAAPPVPPVRPVAPAGHQPPGEELFVSRTEGGQTSLGLPAGVVVRTPYGAVVAAPGPRILAWLIDTGIVWVVALVLTVPIALVTMLLWSVVAGEQVSFRTGGWPTWATAMLVCWCYHAIGLSRSGASFGQRTMRLGVRPWQSNSRLTGRQVLLRSALMTTAFLGGLLGLVVFGVLAATVLTGTTRRGLHEVWTDTCTVHTR